MVCPAPHMRAVRWPSRLVCAATTGIGIALWSVRTEEILHAVGAPVFFFGVSWFYFTRYGHTTALETTVVFAVFVMVVDLLVVALAVNRSLDMFTDPLGTWIPLALIFVSSWLIGRLVTRTPNIARDRVSM